MEPLKSAAEKKNITLSVQTATEGASEDPKVFGNAIQLTRAVVNILTNAIKYTPEGGTVTISSRLFGTDKVSIKIQDTGSGIEPADLPHIFERFYRADKARTRETGGTGLGLAITRDIIARHHGTVEVESTVGKGSTFVMQLPVK